MTTVHDHRFSTDLDRCGCGGEWVWFEPYDGFSGRLPGVYGCEVAGHEFAAEHPADTHGRYLRGRDRLPLRRLSCRRCGAETPAGLIYCDPCQDAHDEALRAGGHRYDLTRQQLTAHHVPCTCGADVDIDDWPAHRGETS